jgi:hypothetical protein
LPAKLALNKASQFNSKTVQLLYGAYCNVQLGQYGGTEIGENTGGFRPLCSGLAEVRHLRMRSAVFFVGGLVCNHGIGSEH